MNKPLNVTKKHLLPFLADTLNFFHLLSVKFVQINARNRQAQLLLPRSFQSNFRSEGAKTEKKKHSNLQAGKNTQAPLRHESPSGPRWQNDALFP